MKNVFWIAFVLLFLASIHVKAQDSVRSVVFTDKYWAFVFDESKRNQDQFDTMYLVRKNEKKDLFTGPGPLRGGVIFRSDGTFESFNYRRCSFDSKGRKGSWVLDKNVITVQVSDHIQWYFRIKYVNGTHYVLRCCKL